MHHAGRIFFIAAQNRLGLPLVPYLCNASVIEGLQNRRATNYSMSETDLQADLQMAPATAAPNPAPAQISTLIPTSGQMNNFILTLIGLGVGMLIISMFYPLGFDQWLFTVGGDMVLRNGAVPYRDFIDTKPPVVFYIYAVALGIFGHHSWAIRAFDVLFQIGTLYYFYRILVRNGFVPKLAALAAFLTLFQYVRGAFETAQCEGFQLLPALLMIDMVLRFTKRKLSDRDTMLYGALAGVAVTILFLLKFTLLPSGIGAALFVLMLPRANDGSRDSGAKMKFLGSMAVGFAASLASYFLQLVITGGWERFGESMTWLQTYASHYPLISRESLVDRYFGEFPRWLMVTFTLTLLAALVGGIARSISPKTGRDSATGLSEPLRLFFMVGLFALLSVIYERKMNEYHYIRAFWAFTPFIAIGVMAAWELMLREWNSTDGALIRKPLVILFAAMSLFFSPLTQIVDHAVSWLPVQLEGPERNRVMSERFGRYKNFEAAQAADVLNPLMKPEDQVFFLGDDLELYFMLDRVPTTIALTRKIRTEYTPQSWKQTMLDQLKKNPPKFAVIERGDRADWETDNEYDSFEALLHYPELREYFLANYHQLNSVNHFEIFQRNG